MPNLSFDRQRFFAAYREAFGRLKSEQVAGLEFLLASLEADPFLSDLRQCAYILATVMHETARTFEPIDERGTAAYFERRYGPQTGVGKRLGNKTKGDGARYHGRGYVQLTGLDNYRKMGERLGLPLADDPDMAKLRGVAYQVMSEGMRHGLFTGKKLADYITPRSANYLQARRIINGTDRAADIAQLAEDFEDALREATPPAPLAAAPDVLPLSGTPAVASSEQPVAAAGPLPSVSMANAVEPTPPVELPPPAPPTSATEPETPKQSIWERLNSSTTFLQSSGIQITSVAAGIAAFFAWPGAPWLLLAGVVLAAIVYHSYQWAEKGRKRAEAEAQAKIRVAELEAQARVAEASKHEPSPDQVAALRAQWEAERIVARNQRE